MAFARFAATATEPSRRRRRRRKSVRAEEPWMVKRVIRHRLSLAILLLLLLSIMRAVCGSGESRSDSKTPLLFVLNSEYIRSLHNDSSIGRYYE